MRSSTPRNEVSPMCEIAISLESASRLVSLRSNKRNCSNRKCSKTSKNQTKKSKCNGKWQNNTWFASGRYHSITLERRVWRRFDSFNRPSSSTNRFCSSGCWKNVHRNVGSVSTPSSTRQNISSAHNGKKRIFFIFNIVDT